MLAQAIALRAMIVGLALALVIDLTLEPGLIALFISYVTGMAFGLWVSWVSWPWEQPQE